MITKLKTPLAEGAWESGTELHLSDSSAQSMLALRTLVKLHYSEYELQLLNVNSWPVLLTIKHSRHLAASQDAALELLLQPARGQGRGNLLKRRSQLLKPAKLSMGKELHC